MKCARDPIKYLKLGQSFFNLSKTLGEKEKSSSFTQNNLFNLLKLECSVYDFTVCVHAK